MKNIHKPILDFMSYYAKKLRDDGVISVLDKLSVDNKDEAKKLLSFLDKMCSHVKEDSINNAVVLNQVVCTSDAEKVCDIIEDYIGKIGYKNLVE